MDNKHRDVPDNSLQGSLHKYYLSREEPSRACLLAMRDVILSFCPDLTESMKYGMPFFSLNGKMFCYLWIDKKTKMPYLGVVEGGRIEHPSLVRGTRARMKILYVDPRKDIPVRTIRKILKLVLTYYA